VNPGEPRDWLFAYGTLGPTDARDAAGRGFEPDAVRGRLYDLGPYPALVDLDDPSASWVEGHVRATSPDELEDVLDPYEGTSSGLFVRRRTRTRAGRTAWVYAYGRPLPEWVHGPTTRWEGRRVDPLRGPRPGRDPHSSR
jgi:gamma-glutamylcyclotransferase (GGCT)/AIG2-like uncharacterized protein YtfP